MSIDPLQWQVSTVMFDKLMFFELDNVTDEEFQVGTAFRATIACQFLH